MSLKRNRGTREGSKYASEVEGFVRACESIRKDPDDAQDITLAEFLQEKESISMEAFYEDLGIDPTSDTIQNLVNLPDPNMRWLIPEIYRDAIRLGLRKNPIYPDVIAGEQSISQKSLIMPAINMSEAVPHYVGVGETIPVGDVSFDQKTVTISKIGRGIKIPYEVMQYVALNVVAIFLQDWGVKLGMGLDTLLISTLINGDQPGGIDSCAVIGIGTPVTPGPTYTNTLVFRDLLRPWVRLARMGKNPSVMIGGENSAMDILDLLTTTKYFGIPRATADLIMKSPLPQNASILVNGNMPLYQTMLIDKSDAIIKLNAQPLLVETEKIVSNQTEETFCTLTTGFATILKDSRLIIDESLAFSGNAFPSYFNPTLQEVVPFL